jgi:hypothetical protein
MSATGRDGARSLLERIRLWRSDRLAAPPALRVVERALLDHRVLRLDYQDKHGSPTRGRLLR